MPDGPEKLSAIVLDGSYERVHYALVLASAAAATNRAVTLFFTGRALNALMPDGWRRLTGGPAGRDAAAEDEAYAMRGVAGFTMLLDACSDLGVRFIACEMGLRAEAITPDRLDPQLKVEVAGIVTFLNDAPKTGTILFI